MKTAAECNTGTSPLTARVIAQEEEQEEVRAEDHEALEQRRTQLEQTAQRVQDSLAKVKVRQQRDYTKRKQLLVAPENEKAISAAVIPALSPGALRNADIAFTTSTQGTRASTPAPDAAKELASATTPDPLPHLPDSAENAKVYRIYMYRWVRRAHRLENDRERPSFLSFSIL